MERQIADDGDVAFRGPSHYAFFRRDGRCRVDLQWRMADRYFAFSLDQGGVAWDLATTQLAGRRILGFSPTDLLLILCVHGAKHQWERLKWICDVAELVRAQRDAIDWDLLDRKAATLRVSRMVGVGLGLARDLLDAELPETVGRRLRMDRTLVSLVHSRRAALFGRDLPSPASAQRLVFYLRARDGWRDRAGFAATFARQLVGRIVRPTIHDTAWVKLPPRLRSLYYLIRPVRVMASYANRGRSTRMAAAIASAQSPVRQEPRHGARPDHSPLEEHPHVDSASAATAEKRRYRVEGDGW